MGLIKKGLAYVCELSPEEFKDNRGDIGVPANSPYRDRPIEESLDLFQRMRDGEFPDGAMTLRAKIDLAIRQLQHAGPGDLPDQPSAPPPSWGQVVHLSHV